MTGIAGDELDLECVVTGGNPPPRLHWYVGSQRMEDAMEMEDTESRTVVSRLSFRPAKDHEGEHVKCIVEHSALTQDMETSATLDIQCKCQNLKRKVSNINVGQY